MTVATTAFPTDLPLGAIRQVSRFVTRQDPDLSRAALAAWQILGYAGHMAFGDVQFLTDQMPMKGDFGPGEMVGLLGEAELTGVINPVLVELLLTIVARVLKRVLTK